MGQGWGTAPIKSLCPVLDSLLPKPTRQHVVSPVCQSRGVAGSSREPVGAVAPYSGVLAGQAQAMLTHRPPFPLPPKQTRAFLVPRVRHLQGSVSEDQGTEGSGHNPPGLASLQGGADSQQGQVRPALALLSGAQSLEQPLLEKWSPEQAQARAAKMRGGLSLSV